MSARSGVTPPAGWKWQPLGRVMRRSRLAGKPEWQPLSVFLDDGVVPRSDRDDNHNQLGADLSNYLVVEPGDLVFNKLRTWQGGFGHSRFSGIVSPAYYVLRPTPALDTRFMDYLLHSSPYLAELTRLSKWMPPSQFDMPWDELKTLPVPLPPLDVQRRIADFLDDQVRRLDHICAMRGRQVELARGRTRAQIDSNIEELGRQRGWTTLRRHVENIEQGWSPQCASGPALPGEPGLLKLSAVKRGAFWPHENKAFLTGVVPEERYALRRGDLLVTRANTPELVGEVAVVEDDYPNLFLCDLIYRVLLNGIDPGFVGISLQSGSVRALLAAVARGTSQSMVKIRGEDIKSLPIPLATSDDQRELVLLHSESVSMIRQLEAALERSARLIEERKRSLITAAVTGDFGVSSASSRAGDVTLSGVGGVG